MQLLKTKDYDLKKNNSNLLVFRNHNVKDATSQEPSRWPDVAKATRKANLFRYYYLPYLYRFFLILINAYLLFYCKKNRYFDTIPSFSLLFDVSLYGGTVIRPVFFEFTSDPETHDLGEQFMWGSAMLIVPVYQPVNSTNHSNQIRAID